MYDRLRLLTAQFRCCGAPSQGLRPPYEYRVLVREVNATLLNIQCAIPDYRGPRDCPTAASHSASHNAKERSLQNDACQAQLQLVRLPEVLREKYLQASHRLETFAYQSRGHQRGDRR